ncbi:MAG: DivIVA domain-containing protein [Actinomycetota bacterium]|nr:DivIVA domain-containing protein [Actinomycetota bacterium]
MALDRQDIERRDFPIARRGYEPEAVDAHLRRVADDVEDLQGERPSGATLATAASEQVRTIVEAAETTAAEIQRGAEEEAARTREKARSDAERARADAAAQAREHVARVQESTQNMLQRVDAMESELGALVDNLRTGANRLSADLTLLEGNLGELRGDATPVPAAEPEAAGEPEPEPELEEGPEEEAEVAAGGDDTEGARLIALNMALNGTPREETDRYLAENFQLDDREELLDDVYSRVG